MCFRTESVYEDEIIRPPVILPDIDLGVLFSNMTQKQNLEDVRTNSFNFIQQRLVFIIYV